MNTTNIIESLNSLSRGINPTIIYNEGWMIRLLVIESMLKKIKIKEFDFGKLKLENWSSEALIITKWNMQPVPTVKTHSYGVVSIDYANYPI